MLFNDEKKIEEVKENEKTALDGLIEHLEKELVYLDPKDKDYQTVVENLGRLLELKKFREVAALEEIEKRQDILKKAERSIDPNILVQVGGFLLATVLCIKAEQVGSITTKAFAFVPRLIGIRRA